MSRSVTPPGSPSSRRSRPTGRSCCWNPPGHPAVKPYRDALVDDGIPLAQFAVDDVQSEYDRLTAKGVTFTQPPTDVGEMIMAVFDDTCGNLIQIIAAKQLAGGTD